MIRRILVTLDGSQLAEDVLPHVEDLARRLAAEVYLLQVISLSSAVMAADSGIGAGANAELVSELLKSETQVAESYLSALASEWRTRGLSVKWEVIRGEPASGIVDFAQSHDIDLIAMSTHGRSGLSRLISGSVAEQVIREAGRPVLVIRPVEKAAKPSESGTG